MLSTAIIWEIIAKIANKLADLSPLFNSLYLEPNSCYCVITEKTQTHDTMNVTCAPKHGGWSDWIESDDSTCAFNDLTSEWTKSAFRICNNPEPQFGGSCEGKIHVFKMVRKNIILLI